MDKNQIEDADIVVDISGGKLASQKYRQRIAELKAENAKLKEEYAEAEKQIKEYQIEIAELEDKIEAYSNQGESDG